MDKKRAGALGINQYLPTEGQGRNEMIEFYAWTFEDAWKAQDEWETRYGPNIEGRGPFHRWIGAQELKDLFKLHQDGNVQAVIEALFVCALNSLPIPRWCERAYLASYRKVRQYKAKSWDEVFGHPHPKGTHLGAKRQEREKAWMVRKRIDEIKRNDPSIPIDGFIFEQVGRELAIGGKTLTENYYYKTKNIMKRK